MKHWAQLTGMFAPMQGRFQFALALLALTPEQHAATQIGMQQLQPWHLLLNRAQSLMPRYSTTLSWHSVHVGIDGGALGVIAMLR